MEPLPSMNGCLYQVDSILMKKRKVTLRDADWNYIPLRKSVEPNCYAGVYWEKAKKQRHLPHVKIGMADPLFVELAQL